MTKVARRSRLFRSSYDFCFLVGDGLLQPVSYVS